MSDALPFTIEDVAGQSIAAVEAGASIIHLHARDPRDGSPTGDPAVFLEYLKPLKDATNAVVSITSGGGIGMSVEERNRAILELRPELSTLSPGSMNSALFGMIPKYAGSWRFDWEEQYLESTRSLPFIASYADIEYMLKEVGPSTGSRFEFEVYDIGYLYTVAHYLDEGLIPPNFLLQLCLGVMGGAPTEIDHLLHLKRTADRLFGSEYHCSVLGGGKNQFNMVTVAATLGTHVRVGLEDSLYIAKGRLASSNAEQVAKIKRILGELSLEVASPDEAREMLGLKGLDHVGW